MTRSFSPMWYTISLFLLSLIKTRPLHCRINLDVPVLDRFFNEMEDTRPDFRLSREALRVLLDLLRSDRQHGWGSTIETLVFLF